MQYLLDLCPSIRIIFFVTTAEAILWQVGKLIQIRATAFIYTPIKNNDMQRCRKLVRV